MFDLLELSKPEYYIEYVTAWLYVKSLSPVVTCHLRSEAALKSGESNVASDTLRRFYDQRFAMSDDS